MRNLLAGITGVFIGSTIIVMLANLTDPVYTWPYSIVWFILSGSDALRLSLDGFLNPSISLSYIAVWILIGLIVGLFSKKGWNILRSALWVGLILGILSLISVLLQTPGYWTSPSRNLDLLYHFVGSMLISLCSIPSAIPVSVSIDRLMKESEEPIPDKIETTCECGAVFKSNPLICSECGKQLRDA